jgi:hypothetical protein
MFRENGFQIFRRNAVDTVAVNLHGHALPAAVAHTEGSAYRDIIQVIFLDQFMESPGNFARTF